jgi:hypothetical protein
VAAFPFCRRGRPGRNWSIRGNLGSSQSHILRAHVLSVVIAAPNQGCSAKIAVHLGTMGLHGRSVWAQIKAHCPLVSTSWALWALWCAINSHVLGYSMPHALAGLYIYFYIKKNYPPISPHSSPSALKVKGNSEYEAPIVPPMKPPYLLWR